MALVRKVVLGRDLNFSIWVSSVTVAIYVALGGLRSAFFNEVLQFVLIWLGALLIPILDLVETHGWDSLGQQIAARIGAGFQEHHGLCAGRVQLLHCTAVRDRDSGYAVEARRAAGRIPRPASGYVVVDRHVGLG